MQKKRLAAIVAKTMKITIAQIALIITFSCSLYAKDVNGQAILDKTVSVSVTSTELEKIITKVQQQTSIKFLYSPNSIKAERKISCTVKNIKLSQFFEEVLKPLNISYKVIDEKILLYARESAMQTRIMQITTVQGGLAGLIKNTKGESLAGVSVLLKNTSFHTMTDTTGRFELKSVPAGSYLLLTSYVGYLAKETSVVVGDNPVAVTIQMAEDVLKLDDIVVTSGNPKKKIESSVAITTVSNKDIQLRAPLNSTDLLKAIPGLTVESTGGDGPGNVWVRGFPQQGGYIFLGIMEDGLPVLPTGFNSIPSADQYYKTDLTIKTIEAVRGGNASIVMPNTPGAVINNISYTGADKQYGQVKLTSGLSQDLYRIDANTGGKISNNIKYNIGGFYRTDQGVIPPGYTANAGGQIKGNMTFNFKNKKGFVRVYGKYLNDKVQWMLTSYYPYDGSGKPTRLPNFDMLKNSLAPFETTFDYTDPSGILHSFDLSDGIHTRLGSGGLQFSYTTNNGWQINNNFRYQHTNTDVTAGLPGTGVTAYDPNKQYYYLGGKPAEYNAGDKYVSLTILAYKNHDDQIVDFLDFKKKINNHSLTIGTGLYQYNVDDFRYQFRTSEELKGHPRRLLINTPTGNGIMPAQVLTRIGNTQVLSAYVSDEIALNPKWRLDIGARIDNYHVVGKVPVYKNSTSTSMVINGYSPFEYNKMYWAVSTGLNYKINNFVAMFGRLTKAYNAPTVNDYTTIGFNPASIKNRPVYLGELGVKYAKNNLSLFASASYSAIKNVTLNITAVSPTAGQVTIPAFGSTRTFSAEVEAYYKVMKNLSLRLTSTLQNAKYTDYKVTANAPNTPADIYGKTFDFTGNTPERVPSLNSELSATYDYKGFNVYISGTYVGSRYTAPSDSYKLPSYVVMRGGAGYNFTKRIGVRGWVDNLLNTRALTEGDVRGDQFRNFATVAPGTLMPGRTLLPRTFWASISYTF